MFNTFQMPLVHQNNNFLSTRSIKLFKKILILLVNKYCFKVREESCNSLCVPVNLELVKTFLSKGRRSNKTQFIVIFLIFCYPLCLSPLKSLNQIIDCIKSSFMSKTFLCFWIKFTTRKLKLSANVFCSFTSILYF